MTYVLSPVTPAQLAGFVAGVTANVTAYYAKDNMKAPTFETMTGPKYTRVVRVSPGERSAFCFIENTTGLILKCAGWKAPAKTARGSINTPTFGAEFVGPFGPAYLR